MARFDLQQETACARMACFDVKVPQHGTTAWHLSDHCAVSPQQVSVSAALNDHACASLCRSLYDSILGKEALSCPLVLPNTTALPLLTTVTLDPQYWSFAVRDCPAPAACVRTPLPGS